MEMTLFLMLLIVAIMLITIVKVDAESKRREAEFCSGIKITITINFTKITTTKIMALELKPGQFIDVEISPVDRKGSPAVIEEGSVVFSSTNESVFTIQEDPTNELKARIVSVGVGVATLSYSFDADLDDNEVRTIEGFSAVEVTPEEAQAVGFVATAAKDFPVALPAPSPAVEPAPIESIPVEEKGFVL
jgi:hypothetical protein